LWDEGKKDERKEGGNVFILAKEKGKDLRKWSCSHQLPPLYIYCFLSPPFLSRPFAEMASFPFMRYTFENMAASRDILFPIL
jgi:hypothetical protein